MRKVPAVVAVVSALVLASCVTPSTGAPVDSSEFVFDQIVETNLSAEDSYTVAVLWFGKTFVSAEAVIQATDSRNVIVGRASTRINPLSEQWGYTVTFQARDGRARITFDQWHPLHPILGMSYYYNERFYEGIAEYCDQLIADFVATIDQERNSDW